MEKFQIQTSRGLQTIGQGNPTFIVAELSANHNQKIETAYKLIDAAIDAGADAIKIQTYTPDTITIDCDKKWFQIQTNKLWAGQTLYQLYQKAYTPWEWQAELKNYAEAKGTLLFSTPFDLTAVDFLEKLGVVLYKIGSFEVVDIPLLKKIGETKKPVIISRGMSTEEELSQAIEILRLAGSSQIAALHCVSSYPATLSEMNLITIPELAKKFQITTGLSDHSLDPLVPIISVALGASIIEKHFILNRSDGGPDAAFSLEPKEFKEMIKNIRNTEMAMGKAKLFPGEKEKNNIIFRRSLFAVQDIKRGETLTEKNIRSIRPGYGLLPKHYYEILGKIARCNIERGTPLSWDLIKK